MAVHGDAEIVLDVIRKRRSFHTGALFEDSCLVLMIKAISCLSCRVLVPCGILFTSLPSKDGRETCGA
jgi:hypothetical protein